MKLFKRTSRFEDYAEEFLAWSQANHRAATFKLHKNNIHALLAHFSGKCGFRGKVMAIPK